jgi:hypothetical protein
VRYFPVDTGALLLSAATVAAVEAAVADAVKNRWPIPKLPQESLRAVHMPYRRQSGLN